MVRLTAQVGRPWNWASARPVNTATENTVSCIFVLGIARSVAQDLMYRYGKKRNGACKMDCALLNMGITNCGIGGEKVKLFLFSKKGRFGLIIDN